MKMETESPKSQAAANRTGFGKRLASVLAMVLLCYFIVAYVIMPLGWKRYIKKHPSFDDNPRITQTSDGHLGDALNVALTGTETQLKAIMLAAHWYPADALGLRSDARIAVDTVLERSYDQAPVSKLYLYGRPEDLAFEQPVGDDPRHRHHVRFWRSKHADQGRPIWLGSATYDERVGLSHTTGQITHHTASDIDAERGHVFDTLQHTDDLAEFYKVPHFHHQLQGRNGGGDAWHTDGALWVGLIKANFGAAGDQAASAETASIGARRTVTESILQADLRVLQSSSSQLEETVAELRALATSAPWRAAGFFDAGQQDQAARHPEKGQHALLRSRNRPRRAPATCRARASWTAREPSRRPTARIGACSRYSSPRSARTVA